MINNIIRLFLLCLQWSAVVTKGNEQHSDNLFAAYHIMDSSRKHLAQQMEEQFFLTSPQSKAAAEPESVMDESTQKLIQLLQTTPEQAAKLLQIYKLLSGNT